MVIHPQVNTTLNTDYSLTPTLIHFIMTLLRAVMLRISTGTHQQQTAIYYRAAVLMSLGSGQMEDGQDNQGATLGHRYIATAIIVRHYSPQRQSL